MSRELLVEHWGPIKLSIVESESQDGRLVAEGEFGFCGKPTSNGRVYPRSLMEREIRRLLPKMESRGLYGELDHPEDGSTKLQRVSHLITNLRIESDGRVIGKLEVLDTPNGQILRKLIESGARTGVSSRGVGSVKKNQSGDFEVQEDFKLLTYDGVADPAWGDALPEYRFEGQKEAQIEDDMVAESIEQLQQKYPEIVQAIRAEERENASGLYSRRLSEQKKQMESLAADGLEKVFSQQAERVRAEVMEQVRQQVPEGIEADAIARIKKAVAPLINESEEIGHLSQRIMQLEASNNTLQTSLQKSEMSLALQSRLVCVPESHREHFMGLLGPRTRFESFDEFVERLDVVAEEFRRTGRYYDSIEENAIRLDEAIELLGEAKEALVTKNGLLDEAKQALIQIERQSLRRSVLLDEAKEELAELSGQLNESNRLKAILERSHKKEMSNLVEKYEGAVLDLENRLTEAELNVQKHQKVIGHKAPQGLLRRLEEANDIDRVNSIVEAEMQSRRPIDVPVGSSNGSRDPLNEDLLRQKIFAVINASPTSVGIATQVESGGRSGKFEIPGLSPGQMKTLTESHGHYIPGD